MNKTIVIFFGIITLATCLPCNNLYSLCNNKHSALQDDSNYQKFELCSNETGIKLSTLYNALECYNNEQCQQQLMSMYLCEHADNCEQVADFDSYKTCIASCYKKIENPSFDLQRIMDIFGYCSSEKALNGFSQVTQEYINYVKCLSQDISNLAQNCNSNKKCFEDLMTYFMCTQDHDECKINGQSQFYIDCQIKCSNNKKYYQDKYYKDSNRQPTLKWNKIMKLIKQCGKK